MYHWWKFQDSSTFKFKDIQRSERTATLSTLDGKKVYTSSVNGHCNCGPYAVDLRAT